MSIVHSTSGQKISCSAILSASFEKIYITLISASTTISFWIPVQDAQLLSSVINKALLAYQETKEQP